MRQEHVFIGQIRRYFACWLERDASALDEIFSPDIHYVECYGPAYRGLAQVRQWFADWNKRGRVLRWDIKRCMVQQDMLACEWFFECEYMGNVDGFDGVTLAVFDQQGKIAELREFQSKAEHHYPYR